MSAFCHCRTGRFAAMRTAKCGKFSASFRHNFRPATHYGMVIKRRNIAEINRRVNIHTYYEATDTLRGLFFKIWANNTFLFVNMHYARGQIFILTSDRLGNSVKWPQWPGLYTTYEATCTLTGLLYEILAKNRFFDWPPWPPYKKNV